MIKYIRVLIYLILGNMSFLYRSLYLGFYISHQEMRRNGLHSGSAFGSLGFAFIASSARGWGGSPLGGTFLRKAR